MATARDLLQRRGFRRLLSVRLATQFADGGFEAAFAILFFFSPERARTPGGIALAVAVLTLPFTLIGPWAGVPLDRWSRRDALVVGSLARCVLVLACAALLITGGTELPLYIAVLTIVSINRFLLAATSAGLPHVVPRDALVSANAITPTMGTVASAIGAGASYAARAAGVPTEVILLGVALVIAVTAGLALRLRRGEIGPDRAETLAARRMRNVAVELTRDMVSGLRHLRTRPTVARALGAITAHRFYFGAATLAMILVVRSRFAAGDAGLSASGLVVGAAAAGLVLAALTTPAWTRRSNPRTVAGVSLTVMGLLLAPLVVRLSLWLVILAAAATGWGGQTVKICVDTIVQRDIRDDYRGRVFSVYDVLFNAAFLLAMLVVVPVIPPDGYAPSMFAVLALGYLVAAWLYLWSRGLSRR